MSAVATLPQFADSLAQRNAAKMPNDREVHPFLYRFPSSMEVLPNGATALTWPDAGGAFGQSLPLAVNPRLSTIHWRPDALSAEECQMVSRLGESLPRIDGRVELGADAYRVSHIAWIKPDPNTHWLFHKLSTLFSEANRHYGFELTGFMDALQYTKYGPEQHFDWHLDIGTDTTSARKLSMTLQLSESGAYEGGALEFVSAAIGEEARQLGSATFFPAFLAHRVQPVQSGLRQSLVAWAYGPAFR